MAGLLGLGGASGLFGGNDAAMQGLLGDMYDLEAIRNMQLKQALVTGGLSMLGTRGGFGQKIGAGLAGGMNAAANVPGNYMDTLMGGMRLKAEIGEMKDRERKREKRDKLDQLLDAAMAKLPEEQRMWAEMNPDKFAEYKMKQAFPELDDNADQIYGTPLWGSDGKPYFPTKKGKAVNLQGIPEDVTLSDPYNKAFQTSAGSNAGKLHSGTEYDIPKVKTAVVSDMEKVDQLINHPGLKGAVGTWQGSRLGAPVMGLISNDVADFQDRIAQIKGGAFLQAYETLKGGGAIANAEGTKAEQAIARLNTAKSEKDMVQALTDYKTAIMRGYEAMQAQVTGDQSNIPDPRQYGAPQQSPQGVPDPLGLR